MKKDNNLVENYFEIDRLIKLNRGYTYEEIAAICNQSVDVIHQRTLVLRKKDFFNRQIRDIHKGRKIKPNTSFNWED